jgi:hypothetical protein
MGLKVQVEAAEVFLVVLVLIFVFVAGWPR